MTSPPPHSPLASILFVNGQPTPLITAYAGEVERLLNAVRLDGRTLGDLPGIVRFRLTGRALGRAVAHELGHFLFASANHAASGLMRARHQAAELIAPFRQAFRVIPPDLPACVDSQASTRSALSDES